MPKETNKRTARQKDADELHTTTTPDPASLPTIVEQSDPSKLKSTVIGAVTTNKGDTNYTKVKKTGFYVAQQTDTILWTPTAGKKFVITDIVVSVGAEMVVHLEDGTTKIWDWDFAAHGGAVINLQTPDESAAVDNVLSITTSAAGRCSIKVLGYEV